MEKVRALVFGEVAHDYDRVRPDYPARADRRRARLRPSGSPAARCWTSAPAPAARRSRWRPAAPRHRARPRSGDGRVCCGRRQPATVVVEVASLERTAAATRPFWTGDERAVVALDRSRDPAREGRRPTASRRRSCRFLEPRLVRGRRAGRGASRGSPRGRAADGPEPRPGGRARVPGPARPEGASGFTDVERRIYRWTRRLRRTDTLRCWHPWSTGCSRGHPAALFDALAPLLPDEVEFAGGTVLFWPAGRNGRAVRLDLPAQLNTSSRGAEGTAR